MAEMTRRWLPMTEMRKRSDGEDLFIEGYFAVFDSIYNLFDGATESIARGAFTDTLTKSDVRALYNHNDDVVLGRMSADTLTLKEDDHGLWGSIKINRNDTDAMNAYARIERGDITGCSFGFIIDQEECERNDDGSIHWTITKVDPLYEVSPCVFPAYEETDISARKNDFAEIKKRELQMWKEQMKDKLRKGN